MKNTICLNMIVKDESKVMERCLASVKNWIDYWVIQDTGSSDGTQKIITEFLKDVPGELHERPWVNFSHNRNAALDLAHNKGDYLLFIDGDEKLVFSEGFTMPFLNKDAYYFATHLPNDIIFYRMLLVNNHLKWVWEGVIHEMLYSLEYGRSCQVMPGVFNEAISNDGRRSQDPQKFQKDARLLENALKDDAQNSRYVFFLAQSYFQAQEYRLALKNYQKRASMGGFEEEVYFSLYMTARLQEKLQMAPSVFLESYQKAYQMRSTRAEPLYWMARYHMQNKEYVMADDLLKKALSIPIPCEMNVERNIYEHGIPLLYEELLHRDQA